VIRARRPVAAGAVAFVVLLARESRADQFVLFDATFTYTWDEAMNAMPNKSHYYVNEGNWLNKARPTNWVMPVNYRDGTVHIHLEVLEKPPGTQQAGWALCYVANVGAYGCPYTDYYTMTGVYEKDVDMHTFYNSNTIQWDSGVKQVDLVYTINGSGMGHITNFPALKDLVTPTRVRIAMVQVSRGSPYDPSILAGSDAGSQPNSDAAVASADGAGTTDAPTSEDAVADSGIDGATVVMIPTSDAASSGGPAGNATAPTSDAAGSTPASPTQTSGCAVALGHSSSNHGRLAFLLALGVVFIRRVRSFGASVVAAKARHIWKRSLPTSLPKGEPNDSIGVPSPADEASL
jgi:hypothetical protein